MKSKHNIIAATLVLFILTISCASKRDYLVTISTSFGDIKLVLFDDTPLHKKNFIELAKAGRYDGTTFHRIIKEFMIQGGDVNTKEGTVPKPEAMIPEEIRAHNIHVRGAVAAARNDDPQKKSSECQFYIVQGRTWSQQELTVDQPKMNQYLRQLLNMPEHQDLRQEFIELQQTGDMKAMEAKMRELKPVIEDEFDVSLSKQVPQDRLEAYTTVGGAPHLDDEYTVFGQVVAGMEVVDAIAELAANTMDKPLEEVSMTVKVEEVKRTKISRLYNYQYPAH